MKGIGTFIVVLALASVLAASATAAPVPTAAPSMEKRPWEMSVKELSRLKPSPHGKLRIEQLSPVPAALPPAFDGPDLIVPDPAGEPDLKMGSEVGFPTAPFVGWVVDWWVKNQGNQLAGATGLMIECDVTVMPPGSPQYRFLKARWCAAFAAMADVPPLAAGATVAPTPYRIFLGQPLWPCSYTDFPRPRVTVTVNPSNVVHESGPGEANNVHVAEFCLGD
jgi:hypothetical protein